MKKRIARKIFAFSIYIILLLLFFIALPCRAIASEKSNCTWSYTVEKGIEKSVRCYLLVYGHTVETPVEKKIEVISKCQMPYSTEGVYGICTHNVRVRPAGKTFSLKTGEDVLMISSTPLLIGTIRYGCCAGADILKVYTENGKYLGTLQGLDLLSRQLDKRNRITTTYGFDNIASYENKMYLALDADEKRNAFRVLVFDKDARTKSIPISVDMKIIANCEEWFLSKFYHGIDEKDLTMRLHGRVCRGNGDDQDPVFTCSVSESAVACSLKKSGN